MIEYIASQFLGKIAQWTSLYEALTGMVMPLVIAGLTIQIMWAGYRVMTGGTGFHILDIFTANMRVFLVVSLALAGGNYATNVVGVLLDLRSSLVGLVTNSAVGVSSYAALDASILKATDAVNAQMPWVAKNTNIFIGNFTGLIGFVCMVVMVGSLVVYAAISAFNLLLIDFSLAFIWVLGPIFVACFAFPTLARFTDAWLGAALKYILTGVVMTAMAAIGNAILADYCTNIAENAHQGMFMEATFSAVGASIILILLVSKAPEIAGNIVGGIGISAMGPGAAAGPLGAISAAGKAGGRGAANLASYGAGAAAGTQPGQAVSRVVGNTVSTITQSTLGQRALATAQHLQRAGAATTDMSPGSVGAAYGAGRGATNGTGTITGGGRPLGRPMHAMMSQDHK